MTFDDSSQADKPGVMPAAGDSLAPLERGRAMKPATWGWLAALVGWTILLSFFHLEGGAGLEPVEAWVAQPAREMHENISRMLAERDTAGWQWREIIIPQFCGETRMQKSPGAYWTVCLVSYLRGQPVDEVSARIPNAIAAIMLVVTIFWLTRRIAGDRAAIFAGFAASSSAMILSWSHGAASDLGVTAWITMSLACLWVASEDEPPGVKRNLLWLCGYLCAGLGMLYKMPLPLPCIGLPAFLYVLLCNRWKIFASWWHLLGLVLFLLPWLPWALAAMHFEETALDKWRTEYFDRVTGDLPNVEDQIKWYFYLFYVGAALLVTVPYTLSIPSAIARPFRDSDRVNRNGVWFVMIWLISLMIFLTVSTGKETRYILPAMPPLFVLLGGELAAFFNPHRPNNWSTGKIGFWLVAVLVPAGLCGAGVALYYFWQEHASQGMFTWDQIRQPYLVTAIIFTVGAIFAALLFLRRRANASFAALVTTMWLVCVWAWPNLMPYISSQQPFKDFAAQLTTLSPEHRAAIKQIAQQDPRYIWYSDVRFPRIIDQLDLLKEQGGRRNLEYETRRILEELVRLLEGDELALFVASPNHYGRMMTEFRTAWEKEGHAFPDTYLWIQARVGRADRRYVLFGNRPAPWEPPELKLSEKFQRKLDTIEHVDEASTQPPDIQPLTPSAD